MVYTKNLVQEWHKNREDKQAVSRICKLAQKHDFDIFSQARWRKSRSIQQYTIAYIQNNPRLNMYKEVQSTYIYK